MAAVTLALHIDDAENIGNLGQLNWAVAQHLGLREEQLSASYRCEISVELISA